VVQQHPGVCPERHSPGGLTVLERGGGVWVQVQ
jgi:hypothetical protein